MILAMGGADYMSVSSDQIFAIGSTNGSIRCVAISILDDGALEGNQTFAVTLTSSESNVMLGISVVTITITDNDC